jgi:hypothetical protein
MSTTIVSLLSAGLQPQHSLCTDAPAIYIGTMAGIQHLPAIDLYNLLAPVGVHPVGSTVSRTTLEKHGFCLPLIASEDGVPVNSLH